MSASVRRAAALLLCALLILSPFTASAADGRMCEPAFNGSFIQTWYCGSWDDARWQQEADCMKRSGVKYLILQELASYSGGWSASYPSGIEELKGNCTDTDAVDACLKCCEQNGIKVFVGLAGFDSWWTFSGLTPRYMQSCRLMAKMQRELYSRYAEKYPNAFYGWYFTPEINNTVSMLISAGNIARGVNKIIDTARELNPDMPVMLSPYYTEYLTIPSTAIAGAFWKRLISKIHFADGDILAPQDAVGAGWVQEKNIESVWQMFRSAADTCKRDLKLWANCENMTCASSGGLFSPPATLETENRTSCLDRFVRQMNVASRYCENIITFSYNHYYCPALVGSVYEDTYLDYIENGFVLENEKPSRVQWNISEDGLVTWEPSTDNIGVAYYKVVQPVSGRPVAVARIEAGDELVYQGEPGEFYYVAAFDGAGNMSDVPLL